MYTLYYTGLNLFLHYTFILVCTQIVLNLLAILSFILRQCQLDLSGNLNFFLVKNVKFRVNKASENPYNILSMSSFNWSSCLKGKD